MDIALERQEFADRLKSALRRARYSPDSPTELARNFNHVYTGRPVTVHAARKWLVAQAIPTQDKLRALASWLEVPADWLRFGAALPLVDATAKERNGEIHALLACMTREQIALVEEMHALEQDERHIVRELITLFFRKQEEARAVRPLPE